MKAHKLIFIAISAFVAVAAATCAIVMFRDQIADFFVEIKDKVESKKNLVFHIDECEDYADM